MEIEPRLYNRKVICLLIQQAEQFPGFLSRQENRKPAVQQVFAWHAEHFNIVCYLPFRQLKNNGLKNRLMGPCRVNPQLSAYLAHVEEIQQDEEKQESHLQSLSTAQLLALAKKHSGPSRTKQTTSSSFSRSPYIAQYAKRRANGFCQLCDNPAPFVAANGEPYLESHHVIWLSQGGQDSIENTVALCPNCHRKMHIINGQADVAKLKRICG